MAPVPIRSLATSEPDTYSLISQAASSITSSIGDSLFRNSARKGFTFNIMSVGPPSMGKTALLSALFGKNLEITKENIKTNHEDAMNPPITLDSKAFEIDDKKVRLKLSLVQSKNYGEALSLKNVHLPLVDYIDTQFADYHKREYSYDRRHIQDKMVHCLFFFISPIGHGLSKLDLEFLKGVHSRVNIIPIIARAETLTVQERASFKRRIKDNLEKYDIKVYQMPDPDPDDTDDFKRAIKEIQDAMPFAVTSMFWNPDNTVSGKSLDWGYVDPFDRNHSDFTLLKTMLQMQMPDLCESTHEIFYEEYRLRTVQSGKFCR